MQSKNGATPLKTTAIPEVVENLTKSWDRSAIDTLSRYFKHAGIFEPGVQRIGSLARPRDVAAMLYALAVGGKPKDAPEKIRRMFAIKSSTSEVGPSGIRAGERRSLIEADFAALSEYVPPSCLFGTFPEVFDSLINAEIKHSALRRFFADKGRIFLAVEEPESLIVFNFHFNDGSQANLYFSEGSKDIDTYRNRSEYESTRTIFMQVQLIQIADAFKQDHGGVDE